MQRVTWFDFGYSFPENFVKIDKFPIKNNKKDYSLASPIPSGVIANMASLSGKHGESYILHTLVSPLPFLRYNLVVEACAIMLPPIGFFGSALNIAAPSTWATTWFVITTATPNWNKCCDKWSFWLDTVTYFIS